MASVKKLISDKDWKEQDLGGKREGKSCLIIRYGGIGDMIQTSSLFPIFKKFGYKITVNCHTSSYNYIKEDPNIDEFFLQEKDQIPPIELGEYWAKLESLFERTINLSESIEGSLLAYPGRPPYFWPQKIRHTYMNHNYQEFIYGIAGINWKHFNGYIGQFYPTKEEANKAQSFIEKIRKQDKKAKIILWALSGSSGHKSSPWVDSVIAQYMLNTKHTYFILVGDTTCKILSYGWRNEPRVFDWTGNNVRETLSVLPYVDCVIGPETGIMNAVGGLETSSILFCSHSSPSQLSKYWKNNICLTPKNLNCFPCHILHYGSEKCNIEKDTHAAMCSYLIPPQDIIVAINKQLKSKR